MKKYNILRGEVECYKPEYASADTTRREEIVDKITRDSDIICDRTTVIVKTVDELSEVRGYIDTALKNDKVCLIGASDYLQIPFYLCEAVDEDGEFIDDYEANDIFVFGEVDK